MQKLTKNQELVLTIVLLRSIALGNTLPRPLDVCIGLCTNIDIILNYNATDELHDELKHIFTTWEHFSGNLLHPVPNPDKGSVITSCGLYNRTPNMYIGKYGELRKQLALHVANNLEKLLD